MDYQHYLPEAIDQVLGWNLPDEALTNAVIAQAGLMAGASPEEIMMFYPD